MKAKVFIIVLFTSLSFNSFAEWISVGAIRDPASNIFIPYASGGGTAQVQTDVTYILESNTGSWSLFSSPGFSATASGGEFKEGTRTLYPGDYVELRAEIFGTGPGYNIATASIWVHVNGAIN